ncbi:hypothetical protein C7121_27165 [Paenibacillus glucanolyticus]|jgi:GH25 family lysozyme M1 (1,4-beta-N-acetylmuramidase)|uniref:hypothetical protein n=1 Tax=Paenibacillus TaxID=44249 RepID=UPI0003E2C244|nr:MULTISPECIES: hypothetical protein [Paenibacillus]ANA81725.1 hypothetical protein A3958_17885 [Paenibacillus glucanolyticus]AVV59544.1 hypothetical protein C7121_27165 [Paenibacillus glucanolyticus]ETT42163.1 Lyzozyme M1 (1,4-beta-N-acetylmuramidase) [Paenibacillus sp. FSL R5-808]
MQSRNRSNAQGIDVSRYQGVVDWAKVKASGKASNITEQRDRIDELEQRLGAIEKNGGSHSG